ncbi:MAG: Nif3-like dinuclear metal center hexameric protein [Victivallaceae bacterium]|nr:Nif3-like dinuclear metal center hexameric protein [Victivallaceae bacterium]
MNREELTEFLDSTLELSAFPGDPSNNGLQVEGGAEVRRVCFGVDANLAIIEHAAATGADFIFVHHGLSWGGEPRRWTGVTAARFRKMFERGISLYAAHLPLDANLKFGHNAELLRIAGASGRTPFCSYHGLTIGCSGVMNEPATPDELAGRLAAGLISPPQIAIFGDRRRPVRRVGAVSGGGGFEAVDAAIADKLDALITGEVTHEIYSLIAESGLTVVKLGHYASETPGVEAMRKLTAAKFGIPCDFVDLPTGL